MIANVEKATAYFVKRMNGVFLVVDEDHFPVAGAQVLSVSSAPPHLHAFSGPLLYFETVTASIFVDGKIYKNVPIL